MLAFVRFSGSEKESAEGVTSPVDGRRHGAAFHAAFPAVNG